MISTATTHSRPRRLPVQWLDAPAVGPLKIVVGASERWSVGAILPRKVRQGEHYQLSITNYQLSRRSRAFTLLELMMVIAIIGFIAVMTLPHVRGFGQANSMATATRQLLDDVSLARQRAMVNRSTVYMVFLPPMFWTNQAYQNVAPNRQETNLLMHQYAAYALISLGSVGDQPGQHFPRYITDWRFLPDGVFIAPFEFTYTLTNTYIYTTNTLSGTVITNLIQPWSRGNVTGKTFPFPSLYPGVNPSQPQNTTNMPLPYIAFSPQGGLASASPTGTDQYIVLARGSIFYPTDTNGAPLWGPTDAPNLVETPPGNDTNNPNLIQIDWMTARPVLLQNQLQ